MADKISIEEFIEEFEEFKEFLNKRFEEVSEAHRAYPSMEQQIRDELIAIRKILTHISKHITGI